jgi:succinate dehydrogenase / fumarate reductase cytochrome b subunit
MKRARPIHLNLFLIRQPLPALVSIGHRVSGTLLFLGIPILLLTLQSLLAGTTELMTRPLFRFALFVVLAAYAFHFFAGLRFLLLDLHWGVELRSTRRAATVVSIAAAVSIVLLGVWLW